MQKVVHAQERRCIAAIRHNTCDRVSLCRSAVFWMPCFAVHAETPCTTHDSRISLCKHRERDEHSMNSTRTHIITSLIDSLQAILATSCTKTHGV